MWCCSVGKVFSAYAFSSPSTWLLLLDDLGTEEERDVGVLQELIDHRYSEHVPTIVTSGMARRALSDHLGAPYVRRLMEQKVRRSDGEWHPLLFLDLFS